jgi:hypothetical protein
MGRKLNFSRAVTPMAETTRLLKHWLVPDCVGVALAYLEPTSERSMMYLTPNALQLSHCQDILEYARLGYWEKALDPSTVDSNILDQCLEGACSGGHLELVDAILFQGSPKLDKGFVEACKLGHLQIVRLLIEYNNILPASEDNQIGKWGILHAMQCACANGHVETVRTLINNLKSFIDTNFSMQHILRPAVITTCSGCPNDVEILELLINAGASGMRSAMCKVCYRGNPGLINVLLAHGVTVELADKLNLYGHLALITPDHDDYEALYKIYLTINVWL